MRVRLLALIAATALATLPAFGADFPVLRGTHTPELPPPPPLPQYEAVPWDGFYLGGFAGFGQATFNAGSGRNELIARHMRLLAVEAQHNVSTWLQPQQYGARAPMYGAFIGYNWSSAEAVWGLEADYMRFGRGGTGVDTIGRQVTTTAVSTTDNINLTGTNSTRLDDLFSIRARAGYAMGSFMPYVTGGVAFGYGRVTNTARVQHAWIDSDPASAPVVLPGNQDSGEMSSTRTRSFMSGFTVGAGAEAMLGSLILRGEYLYTRLQAQGGVTIDMNQIRGGVGVKF